MARDASSTLLAFNLKRLRGIAGLSQAKLAEKADLSTNFISELEGEKVWVSAATLDRIASALGVKPHSFFLPAGSEPTGTDELLLKCLRIFEESSDKAIAEIRAKLAHATDEFPESDAGLPSPDISKEM